MLYNEEMISKAYSALNTLIDSTHAAIHESTEMIDRMHLVPELMDGVLQIAAKANKAKAFTARDVLKKYREDIEQMVATSPTPQ